MDDRACPHGGVIDVVEVVRTDARNVLQIAVALIVIGRQAQSNPVVHRRVEDGLHLVHRQVTDQSGIGAFRGHLYEQRT